MIGGRGLGVSDGVLLEPGGEGEKAGRRVESADEREERKGRAEGVGRVGDSPEKLMDGESGGDDFVLDGLGSVAEKAKNNEEGGQSRVSVSRAITVGDGGGLTLVERA